MNSPRPWITYYNDDPGPDPADAADTCRHGSVIYGDGDCELCEAKEADAREPEEYDFEMDYYPEEYARFQDPDSESALRLATPTNPRNLPCPTCGRANRLTPADVALHYQCDECAEKIETGG